MKVIVATSSQHPADSPAARSTVDGEVVMFPVAPCDCTDCECSRGFVGVASSGATSTALVVNLPGMTLARLREALFDSLNRGGWLDLLSAAEADEVVDGQISLIRRICRTYPTGTLIRRHDSVVWDAA